jgi:hypothetical protein
MALVRLRVEIKCLDGNGLGSTGLKAIGDIGNPWKSSPTSLNWSNFETPRLDALRIILQLYDDIHGKGVWTYTEYYIVYRLPFVIKYTSAGNLRSSERKYIE